MKRLLVCGVLLSMLGASQISFGAELPDGMKLVKKGKESVQHYEYTIKRPEDGVEVHLELVKVGDKFYGVPLQLENGRFKQIPPKVIHIPIKADFLDEIVKEFKSAGINPRIGNDKNKPTLYLIFDAFCPHCIRQINNLDKLKEKYNVVLLPFAVHGEQSVNGLSCIYTKAKKTGMEKAVKEVIGWKNGKKWNEYAEKVGKCEIDEQVKSLVRNVSDKLFKNKVNATPTFFLKENGKFYKSIGAPVFKNRKK